MFKRVLKWLGAITAVVVIAIAIFLVNLIWFRPWSLNLFYEKVFAEILFDHPEILSTLGLVEQFGVTGHNGKLDDESPSHQQREFDRWKRDLEQLHQYPLDRQSSSQKLSTRVLDWFLQIQAEGEKWQWHDYPVNQLFGVQNQFPSFMANTHRLLNRKDCDYYVMRLDALPKKFDQTLDGLKVREQKLIDYFQAILPKTTTDDGVWKLPDGDAFYAYKLHENTTTKLKPDEVHELGLREVARIEDEMRAILDANGFAGQPIGEAMDKLAKDPRFLYPNNDKGRAEALARYTELIAQATERSSKQLFLTTPRAKIEVRRVPEFKEATAPGAYYDFAAMDGTRPGIFFANLRDMNEVPKWSMPTLAYHEGVPGHHWQISTAEELKGLPQFRKVIPFTAYMEGWALYCEWLAKHVGWYDHDPFGDLGRLRDELFRAVRLVVDTGIHAKRWTREQAIAYMREKTGMGEKEVKSEIERYIVAPGQACAYKIGMLKIQELRARAEKELGARFDQREFHDTVLKNGALPLEILEEQVNEYIQRKKSA